LIASAILPRASGNINIAGNSASVWGISDALQMAATIAKTVVSDTDPNRDEKINFYVNRSAALIPELTKPTIQPDDRTTLKQHLKSNAEDLTLTTSKIGDFLAEVFSETPPG
jgi:hypothetical protein